MLTQEQVRLSDLLGGSPNLALPRQIQKFFLKNESLSSHSFNVSSKKVIDD